MEWVSRSGSLLFAVGVASALAGTAAAGVGWSLHGLAGAAVGVLMAVLGRVSVLGGRRWRHLREAA